MGKEKSAQQTSSTDTKGSEEEAVLTGMPEHGAILVSDEDGNLSHATKESVEPGSIVKPEDESKSDVEAAAESDEAKDDAEAPVAESVGSFDASLPEEPVMSDEDKEDADLIQKLLRTNEREFVSEIVDEVEKRRAMEAARQAEAEAKWSNFYKTNADLAKHKDLVDIVRQSIVAQFSAENRPLSWEEGTKLLAAKARSLISSTRSDYEAVDTDEASATAVVSSSAQAAPIRVKEPARRKSFVDQIKGYQARKGKTAS